MKYVSEPGVLYPYLHGFVLHMGCEYASLSVASLLFTDTKMGFRGFL